MPDFPGSGLRARPADPLLDCHLDMTRVMPGSAYMRPCEALAWSQLAVAGFPQSELSISSGPALGELCDPSLIRCQVSILVEPNPVVCIRSYPLYIIAMVRSEPGPAKWVEGYC